MPRKSMVRLIDRPDMTLDVYRGCKTIIQQHLIRNFSACSNDSNEGLQQSFSRKK